MDSKTSRPRSETIVTVTRSGDQITVDCARATWPFDTIDEALDFARRVAALLGGRLIFDIDSPKRRARPPGKRGRRGRHSFRLRLGRAAGPSLTRQKWAATP